MRRGGLLGGRQRVGLCRLSKRGERRVGIRLRCASVMPACTVWGWCPKFPVANERSGRACGARCAGGNAVKQRGGHAWKAPKHQLCISCKHASLFRRAAGEQAADETSIVQGSSCEGNAADGVRTQQGVCVLGRHLLLAAQARCQAKRGCGSGCPAVTSKPQCSAKRSTARMWACRKGHIQMRAQSGKAVPDEQVRAGWHTRRAQSSPRNPKRIRLCCPCPPRAQCGRGMRQSAAAQLQLAVRAAAPAPQALAAQRQLQRQTAAAWWAAAAA